MQSIQVVTQTEEGLTYYDMPVDAGPCSTCGACCRQFRVSFYQGELDTFPGGFVPTGLTSPVTPFLVCMRGTEQGYAPCIALQEDNRCRIYEQRPSTCREMPVYLPNGQMNPRCLDLRRLQGIDQA